MIARIFQPERRVAKRSGPDHLEHLEIDAKCDVIPKRQIADVDAFRHDEGLILAGVDHGLMAGFPTKPVRNWRRRARAP